MYFGKPTLSLVAKLAPDKPVANPGANQNALADQQKTPDALPPDALSVEALYHTYHQNLLHYLIGLLPGGKQDALEVLHETYIRLLRQKDLERLRENPRAYIFTIATNLVRDLLRRRTSRMVDAHVDFDDLEILSAEPSPPESFSWERSLDRLKDSLMLLPITTRKIFLLSRFDELTYPEIAQALGISTRTVERHMSSAMKALQHSLEDLL